MTFKRLSDESGDWLRQSFLMPRSNFNQLKTLQKQYGEVRFKFTETTLGGMYTLNSPPQSCQFADPRKSGRYYGMHPRKWLKADGMGTAYSDAIDDHAERITLRFGVPEFNSLTTFFTGFYDSDAAYLARTGRVPNIFYKAGKAAGFILSLPLLPVILGGNALRWAGSKPANQYYYFNPAMPLFWNRLNMLANHLTPALRMSEPVGSDNARAYRESAIQNGGGENEYVTVLRDQVDPNNPSSGTYGNLLHNVMPELFDVNGDINIYKLATRAARLEWEHQKAFLKILEEHEDKLETSGVDSSGRPIVTSSLYTAMDEYLNNNTERFNDNPDARDMDEAFIAYAESSAGIVTEDYNDGGTKETNTVNDRRSNRYISSSTRTGEANLNGQTNSGRGIGGRLARGTLKEDSEGALQTIVGWVGDLFDYYDSERRDGSAFISFHVDKVETVNESFSNSVRESDLSSKINSTSSSARNARFNFAEGNLADGGILGLGEKIFKSIKDLGMGLIDGVQMSGFFALAGGAFVDIPKHWDSSDVSLPSTTYTMQLRSVRHDKYSILSRLYIPLLALIAGAAPTSTGRSSYTSPLLCQVYHTGKGQVRTGMISSLSITRGTGSIGWTKDNLPLGIDISFTVVDLSTVMHIPLSQAGDAIKLDVFDEESKLNDYIAMLGGLSIADQIYIKKKFALSMNRTRAQFNSWRSPARWANWFNGTAPGRIINLFSRELDRPF